LTFVFQNLLIDKVCLVNLNYDPAICSNLTNYKDNEKEVEKVVASINMYLIILTSIPVIIVSLFLGPWSDVNGRKPLLIFPQIGIMLTQSIYVINAYQTSLPGEFILLASIGSLFGGLTAFLIGVYSYISDVSTGQARTYRIALIDFIQCVGYPLGTYLSGPLYKYSGYYTVFGLVSLIIDLNFDKIL
jgi:PCFT/HCP family folate transporter-like MFS transporter 1/3